MADSSAFAPIRLSSGGLSVEVLPQGAALHRVVVKDPRSGEDLDVIAGPEDPRGHVSEGRRYYTQIVGRYANRLLAGKSSIATEHGNIELDLDPNREPLAGGHGRARLTLSAVDGERFCLHAGYSGYDLRAFERVPESHPLVGQLFLSPRGSTAEAFLHLHSPDGDQGFPGALDVVVRVEARQSPTAAEGPYGRQAGVVTYEIKARLADNAPKSGTPVNMTLHAGYLPKRREEADGIRGQKLSIKVRALASR